MSLDYPLFEAMKARGLRKACIYWRVGDTLYYIGLLSAILAPLAIGAYLTVARFPGRGLVLALTAFVLGAAVCVVGMLFKGRSHAIAEEQGVKPFE